MAAINRWAVSLETPDQKRIAAELNASAGMNWQAPPYTGEQVATLPVSLSLAKETQVTA